MAGSNPWSLAPSRWRRVTVRETWTFVVRRANLQVCHRGRPEGLPYVLNGTRYPKLMQSLPIDERLAEIVSLVRERRALVVTAPPGAGKTTRVPPALADDGPLILLQPRRVAARAIARRIADERGWTIGREVGWHVRGDRRAAPETRVLVATEGILTARLQQDAQLKDFRTVVI